MKKIFFKRNRQTSKTVLGMLIIGMFGFVQAQEWELAQRMGDFEIDKCLGVVSDSQGNIFVTGLFYSPTMTFGNTTLINAGGSDFYMAKFNSQGEAVFAINLGNDALESGVGIAVDESDNVYVTGYFTGATLEIGSFSLINYDTESSDIFVAKFNNDGEVQWAKSAGSESGDGSNDIAVDQNGYVFVTGYFAGNEMHFESTTLTSFGNMDIFTVRYDADGNEMWAINAGGDGFEQGIGISTDNMGNSYVTGYFSSETATFGFAEISNEGINDIFVVKYDENGIEQWVKGVGGSLYEGGTGITTDSFGNVYLTGYFASTSLDFGNGVQISNQGSQSVFVAKYDTDGAAIWAISSKGIGDYMAERIAVGPNGNSFVVGQFTNSNFGFDDFTFTNKGGDDIFLIQFNNDGQAIWADSMGGSNFDQGKRIYSRLDDLYIGGSFSSNTISLGSITLNNFNAGKDDAFFAKLNVPGLGVTETSVAESIQVYPNPNSGLVYINSNFSKLNRVEVFNVVGQLLYKENPISKSYMIDLRNMQNGVYLLKFCTDKTIQTKKLILRK